QSHCPQPPTLTRKPGEALRLTCKTSGFNLATSSRYWYRQLPGKQRESLLGYHSASNKYFVAGIEIRVTVIKDFPNNIFVLIIKSLTGTQVVETPRGRGNLKWLEGSRGWGTQVVGAHK
uniref:Immunoglobulin V-set domain-containing protein n=1 Tax=Callorhinchus milii TaxID=7868 RepID=A0A4W3GMS6_CALMI